RGGAGTPGRPPGARGGGRARPARSSASRAGPTGRKRGATSRTHFRRRVRGHTVTMKRVTVERHATGRRREVYRIRFELGNEPLAYFMWLQEARDEGLRIIDV
ncbi:MAG TPA: hypothetical protein PJ982_12385, partial [Lacipirellulaceae bacterium]|nr:hypothetical protein [Lacipirellulaceae bacterium]